MLREYDVTDVFGLPGETTLDLYRAWDEFSDIAYHMCRDERNSVFMADGYAKATGKVGICEGPSVGATHMIPGVTEAHGACIPMLVFTSDVELHTTKKNMLTGFNQTAIFEGITKESYTVTKGIELPFLIRRAFRAATSGRPGPVHIRIPMNIFSEELPDESIFAHPQYGKFPGVRSSASKEDIRKAVDELVRASRPVMICGQGAIHSGAWDAVLSLATKMNIPVGSTINAKGIFQETHPLSLGVIGARGGREWANRVILESDLVLLVGSSTDSAGTSGWRVPNSNSETKVIQIDISELELGNNYNVLPLLGDAKETLERILETLPENGRNPETPSWAAKVLAAGEAFEKKFAYARHGEPDFKGEKCFRHDGLGLHGQVQQRDGRDEGRILDEGNTLTGQRRQGVLQGLRQDDPPVDAASGHAQTECAFPLPSGDGQNGCADDFRGVRAFKKDQSQNGGLHAAHVHHRRQNEIDEKDLHQKRRVADQLQIGPSQKPAHGGCGKAQQRDGQSQNGRAREAEERDHQRYSDRKSVV